MRPGLLSVGILVLVAGCSSSAQFSSSGGGSGGKAGSGAGGGAGSPAGGGAGSPAGGGAGSPAGGSAGAAGTGSADGGAGTAGQGGAPAADAGAGCTWSPQSNPCGSGFFCNALGCGAGKCIPVNQNTGSTYNPVCGCDGVTYWNPSVAGHFGMAVRSTGKCPLGGAVMCSASNQCADGRHCNNRRDVGTCTSSSTLGVCWGLPEQCPAGGPTGAPCVTGVPNGTSCVSKCQLIQDETPWYKGVCNPD